MNRKPNFNVPSGLLISTLIATSFFMVNCNKGTDKKGIKTKTVAGGKTTADSKTQKSTDVVACSKTILDSYKILYTEAERVKNKQEENKTSSSSEKRVSDYEKITSLCTDLDKEFDKERIKNCKYPDSKDKSVSHILDRSPVQCAQAAEAWKKEDGTESIYLKSANDQKVIAEKKSNNSEEFKNLKLLISEDMKSMLKPENLNFKQYIVDGEIKSDADDMQKAFESKKVVCSFTGTSTELPLDEKIYLSVASYIEAEDLPEGIRGLGLAMVVSTEKPSDLSGTSQTLGCSHLSKDKIDIQLLKKALGKHLITETDSKNTELQRVVPDAEQKIKDDFRTEEHK